MFHKRKAWDLKARRQMAGRNKEPGVWVMGLMGCKYGFTQRHYLCGNRRFPKMKLESSRLLPAGL